MPASTAAHRLDHLATRPGALAERLDDLLHLVVEPLARGDAVVAALGARPAGVRHQRAHPRHERARRRADVAAIDAQVHRLGVVLLAGLDLLVAVVEALVALLRAVRAVLRAPLVDVILATLGGTRLAGAGSGRQPGRGRPEDTEQFPSVHRCSPHGAWGRVVLSSALRPRPARPRAPAGDVSQGAET